MGLLCIIPLRGEVDIVYTNDEHFLHPTLKHLVPKVDNPIGRWLAI